MRHPARSQFSSITVGVLLVVAGLASGCDGGLRGVLGDGSASTNSRSCTCTVPSGNCEDAFVDSGVGRDGIPALRDPSLTEASAAHLDRGGYLADSSRVIGLVVDGQALAVPHNILWHHEIANVKLAEKEIAVTYCPLTGSALAFDRSGVDGAPFVVSGLLFNNNLVMIDETSDESLWPQMNRKANCGPKAGATLQMIPVVDLRWDRWTSLYPQTKVLSEKTGFNFNYTPSGNRYRGYQQPNNDNLFVPMPVDERRPPKERVLGIPEQDGGVALPFQALDDRPLRAIETSVGGTSVVVFWNRAARAAMAYERSVDGTPLSFIVRDDVIVDTATESSWTVSGKAVDGPMTGTTLDPIEQAYTAFWFAWAAFHPDTQIWTESKGHVEASPLGWMDQ